MDSRIILYALVLVGSIFLKLVGERNQDVNVRKHYIIFICIVLGFESSLRHLSVGPDTYNYYNFFNTIQLTSWSEILNLFSNNIILGTQRDVGFNVFMKLFQVFSTDFHLFLAFISLLYFGALGNFLYRNTKSFRDVVFAFVLYVSLFHLVALSGIRQQITTAFALYALIYIQKREPIKFSLLVLFGSTVHASLLIIIPLYLLSYLSPKNAKIFCYLPIILFPWLYLSARGIFGHFVSYLQNDYYMGYYYSERGGEAGTYIILSLMVSIFGIININKVLNLSLNSKIYYIAIALMTFFVPLVMVDRGLIRVGQYFSLYLMIFVPHIVRELNIDEKINYIIFLLLIIILLSLNLKTPFQYYFFWQYVPE